MSVQKLKIFKKGKGIQGYSKNIILDSLIKQKLQSQMIIIKDNFNTIINKQQIKQKQIQLSKSIKKRRLSTHNLASITNQKIKQSIYYQYKPNQNIIKFIIDRQTTSPFISNIDLDKINTARTNYQDITTKLQQSDKVNYQNYGIKNNKIDQKYHLHLQERLKSIIPSDVWLPSLPEMEQIISHKAEVLELSPLKISSHYKTSQTQRPSSFDPLKGNRQKNIKKINEIQNEITYDPLRYHKNDYISLQKWFDLTLQLMNKKSYKIVSKQQLKSELNEVYSIYMATFKQLIRLTYIQSTQKGLIIQKILWSFIRLIQQLISQQHKINYQQFIQSSKQLKNIRELYQSRISKLQNLLRQKQSIIQQFQKMKKNIIMSCLTYKKVNYQMKDQINILTQEIQSLYKQNDYLMNNLKKLIYQFQSREIIKIQKQQKYLLYYYLNQKNQIDIIAKVPREQLLDKFFQSSMKQAAIHKIQQEVAKSTSKIDKLENQLNVFWQKKRTYLQIDKMIQENMVSDISQKGIQTQVNGPYQYADIAIQFPQQNQQTFQDYLKKQLIQQRSVWTKKQIQLKDVTISLKQLYDQARQSISILSSQNISLKQAIDQKDHEISYLKRKIQQVQQKVLIFNKKINYLQKQLQSTNQHKFNLQQQIKRLINNINQQKKKISYQKQNNNILVSTNYQLKLNLQNSNKQFQQLESKIKILAPHLEQLMALAQTSQNNTLLKISNLIEINLSKYVEKDARLFLTH